MINNKTIRQHNRPSTITLIMNDIKREKKELKQTNT